MRQALLSVALVAACGAPPAATEHPVSNHGGGSASAHELLGSISRTACFGWCPVYTLTVYRDGAVEYDGEDYVKTKGHATGTLPPETLGALDDLFQKHDYFALQDKYTSYDATDAPSVTTSYASAGRTKKIEHYLGDMHAPKVLGEIEDGFDKIVGIERWIGTEQEREKLAHTRQP
jgi:hypothetical protein